MAKRKKVKKNTCKIFPGRNLAPAHSGKKKFLGEKQ
jgi:hypothetical protein